MSIKVTVSVPSQVELDFNIKADCKSESIFENICTSLGLRETWFFGLCFTNGDGKYFWIDLEKKFIKQAKNFFKSNSSSYFVHFRIKNYPEIVEDHVLDDQTLNILYHQVRSSILSGEIFCSMETAVLLASFDMQFKHSDSQDWKYTASLEKLIPAPISKQQYHMTHDGWIKNVRNITTIQELKKICDFQEQHVGMCGEEAQLEYLKVAENLEMFAVSYYFVKNKKGTQIWLGLDPHGINYYSHDDKVVPKVGFPWSEMKKISANRNNEFKVLKYIVHLDGVLHLIWRKTLSSAFESWNEWIFDKKKIQFEEEKSVPQISRVVEEDFANQILMVASGYKELSLRNRRPDSVQVAAMKEQRNERFRKRQETKEKLRAEIKARKQVEAKVTNSYQKVKQAHKNATSTFYAAKSTSCPTRDASIHNEGPSKPYSYYKEAEPPSYSSLEDQSRVDKFQDFNAQSKIEKIRAESEAKIAKMRAETERKRREIEERLKKLDGQT